MDDVAVIITCFDLGRTLDEAVASVEAQHVRAREVVIVDDGSQDRYTVQCLHALRQQGYTVLSGGRRGVGAARNRGARHTVSPLVVFLDGDDRLAPGYIEQLGARLDDPDLSFVTCGMRLFGDVSHEWSPPPLDLIAALTRGVPHVSSLMRRTLFDAVGGFDDSSMPYEDLAFWAEVAARGVRGATLPEPLLEYRVRSDSRNRAASAPGRHDANMASIYARHAEALTPLTRALLLDKERVMFEQVEYRAALSRAVESARSERGTLAVEIDSIRRELRSDGLPIVPPGSRPVSELWGFDRGLPIDRVYIHQFLERHASDITGDVIEVKDSGYTRQFGTDVRRAEVLDIDASNLEATVIADLSAAASIPADSFDCFLLTQTLGLVLDVSAAIGHAIRVLKPGGVLLCTVPAAGRLSPEPPAADGDYWRFTEASVRALFARHLPLSCFDLTGSGNVTAVSAFLYGFAAHEVAPEVLAVSDPAVPLVYCIRAVKPAAPTVVPDRRTRVTRPPVVLMYHRFTDAPAARLAITAGELGRHLDVLTETNYTIVPLQTLVDHAGRGDADGLAALTADDGYVDCLEAGRAIEARGAAATFFISTAALDSPWEYWWDALDRVHQAHAPGPSVESGQAYQLHAERAEQLMRASRDEQHRLLRSWCRASKTPFVSPGSLTLNRLQVATLARMAGISIGSHGVSHLSLPHQPASVQTLELRESKLVLEQLVGRPVTALAYPFGSHSAETRRLARDAGYDIAVTSEDRATARHEPRLAVSRVDVSTLDARQLRERLEALRQ